MRYQALAVFVAVATSSAGIPASIVAAAPMQTAELAARTGDGPFEFRGRYNVWKFSADGRVTADESRIPGLTQGGSSEAFGIKRTGTWHRVGNQICIAWGGSSKGGEDCYHVLITTGSMVYFSGRQIIEGTLQRTGEAPFAETPVRHR